MRIGIGASSFGQEDPAPLRLLESAGVTVLPNPFRRRMTEPEIIGYLVGEKLDGLLAGLEPLNRRVLESARGTLRALARVGIGMANVDQAAAKEMGIKVSSTPDGPTEAVAEATLAALLCLLRHLEPMNRALHQGEWPKSIGRSLAETTVLVIGFGRIGRRVAWTLSSLGARVLACDPHLGSDADWDGFTPVSLAEGLAAADAVTLHANGEKVILGREELAQVRPGALVLNSARGGLIDESALVEALETGRVGKAWLDAFWEEPYRGPLLKYPQVLLTPHAATYTRRCRLSMETEAARNVLRDLGLAVPA
jgi:D-3-phosphoglycerate dehydrogenase